MCLVNAATIVGRPAGDEMKQRKLGNLAMRDQIKIPYNQSRMDTRGECFSSLSSQNDWSRTELDKQTPNEPSSHWNVNMLGWTAKKFRTLS